MQDAISRAMDRAEPVSGHAFVLGVNVSAQFGLFSDDQVADQMPDGTPKPRFQNVPVWIVTFTWPMRRNRAKWSYWKHRSTVG